MQATYTAPQGHPVPAVSTRKLGPALHAVSAWIAAETRYFLHTQNRIDRIGGMH